MSKPTDQAAFEYIWRFGSGRAKLLLTRIDGNRITPSRLSKSFALPRSFALPESAENPTFSRTRLPMQQVTLQQPGEFVASDVPFPNQTDDQVLVRVRTIGVCGTDLHAFAGRQPYFTYPRILGHELGVEVLDAPSGCGLSAGDICALEPYLWCGKCHSCKLGRENCCESLQVMGVHCDGGMREQIVVPADRLHKSTALSLDQLALVETLGIGAHAIDRSELHEGQSALIVGAGPIGLAVTQFAMTTGADITVLELNPQRREFVDQFDITAAESAEGKRFDVVFDATGSPKAMEASFDYVEFAGTLVLVSLVQARISFDDPTFHRREMTIKSSRNSAGLFPRIMAMIDRGEIDTKPWVSHRLELAEVPDKFPQLPEQPDLVKAIIEIP